MKQNRTTQPAGEPALPRFSVLVKASRSIVHGLTVDSVTEPQDGESFITFITKAGKRWKMHFHEFSFVFPSTTPKT